MAYAHTNTLWPSIRESVSRNLSVSYPVYTSSSIIYALIFVADNLLHICLYRPISNLCHLIFVARANNENYSTTKLPQSMICYNITPTQGTCAYAA